MRIWPMLSLRLFASRDFLFSLQHPDGYWCGELEADSMLEADYIFLHTLLGERRSGTAEARLDRDDALPERGWKLEHLSRRSGQYFAFGEVLLFCQADGSCGGRSAAGEVPRVGSGARRRGGVQHLHQDVSVRAGPVRLRCGAGDSAGDCSFSELVLLQYLRNFFVVAVDSCAAGDYLREEAVQEDSAGAGNRRAVCGRPRELDSAPAQGSQAVVLVAQFLYRAGPDDALGRSGSSAAGAHDCAAQGGEVAAGAAGDDGRAGRHLSGHAERDHCAALPGLLRRRSAGDSRARRV